MCPGCFKIYNLNLKLRENSESGLELSSPPSARVGSDKNEQTMQTQIRFGNLGFRGASALNSNSTPHPRR